MLAQNLYSAIQSGFRGDAAISPNAQNQAVEIGLLTNAGVLDVIRDPGDGCVHSVDGNRVDAILGLVTLAGHVTHALFDANLHHKLAALADGAEVLVAVDDFSVARNLEISSRDDARALGAD